jgi:hypothetical protein
MAGANRTGAVALKADFQQLPNGKDRVAIRALVGEIFDK